MRNFSHDRDHKQLMEPIEISMPVGIHVGRLAAGL
mgnify:CR=1 FL=1